MSGTLPLDDDPYVTTRGEPPAEPELPQRTRKRRPTVADLPKPEAERDEAPPADDAVAAMARRLKDAEDKAVALEAERTAWQKERDELSRGKAEAETRGVSAQKQALLSEISATERQIAAARQRRRVAREAGDFDAEDTADHEMVHAATHRAFLERDKIAWDNWEAEEAAKAETTRSRQPDPAPPAPPADRLNRSDQEWVDRHPLWNDDEYCEPFIRARATKIIRDGVRQSSPEFYRQLDRAYDEFRRLRAAPEPDDEPPPARSEPQRRAAPSAASMAPAPSRGSGEGARQRGVSIEAVARRLNATVDEMRTFVPRGSTLEKYAQEQARYLGMI